MNRPRFASSPLKQTSARPRPLAVIAGAAPLHQAPSRPVKPRRRRGGEAPHVRYCFGGIRTLLTTWMTPFEALTSAMITRAPPTYTLPPDVRIGRVAPSSVFADVSIDACAAVTDPLTTW